MTGADDNPTRATVGSPYAERLHRVIEAGLAMNAELSIDDLLSRIVESAASLTGAQYAALGVIDPRGSELERFVTFGVDEATRQTIGELPRGRGILGAMIRDVGSLRLHNLHDDPRSVGFPPGHPSMTSFLGVPILVRRVAFGNLYLTEKAAGEDFTDEDERLIGLLAAQAGVAIENARLQESSTRWARQLESLAEISAALASEVEPKALLGLVCERISELVSARFVYVAMPLPDGSLEIAAAAGESVAEAVGRRLHRTHSKSAMVMQRGRGERVDFMLDDLEADRALAREWGIRAAIFVPLLVRGQPIGVIAANDHTGPDARFSESDFRLVEQFADRAAIAIGLSERVERDTVARILESNEHERKRIARELHDETAQALMAILFELAQLDTDTSEDMKKTAERVRTALASVRKIAVDLRPSVLDDYGLVPALSRFVDDVRGRTDLTLELITSFSGRLPDDLETALYRITQEAVANAIHHGRARTILIRLDAGAEHIALTISDDGKGFDPARVPTDRFGLVGMRERATIAGAHLDLDSKPGQGTCITVRARAVVASTGRGSP